MDVISILRKKQQPVTAYAVEAAGTQVDEHPNDFRSIEVTHIVEGRGVDENSVRRAIELSATRYCSVGATLAGGRVEVTHRLVLRAPDGTLIAEGSVITLGPLAEPLVPALTTS
jgi:putative redox protein